jgi:hypothetical protein
VNTRDRKDIRESRLDFFLISGNLVPYITTISVWSNPDSDHRMIVIGIGIEKIKRGNGFWKLNSSHLRTAGFVEKVKEKWVEVLWMYQRPNFSFTFSTKPAVLR